MFFLVRRKLFLKGCEIHMKKEDLKFRKGSSKHLSKQVNGETQANTSNEITKTHKKTRGFKQLH